MIFQVTQEDINNSLHDWPDHSASTTCPVTRSICRELGIYIPDNVKYNSVRTMPDYTDIVHCKEEIHIKGVKYPAPKSVVDFVIGFDTDCRGEPFTFELEGFNEGC